MEISGRKEKSRINMWILKDYIVKHENLDAYKLFFQRQMEVESSGSL